ncbi:sigma-70 family RNA polymerase sigma factor [uncultured Agathobaculum sp.]|uniref:sigma-70 family RNA polymerase sigma factor n=1 Tax=uncultured Agathobaculum sp. TaxID=2048140 RepID=UPI0032083C00
MTNEELAAQAKAGDKDALAQLWEQNRGLLSKLFRELANKAGARMAAMGITWEDVEQSFFLAVALAVRLYEPERGVLFASFLSYPVKQVFFELVGWRTEQQRRDPLGQCLSLDEPISEADGTGLRGDFIPDTNDAYEDAEDQLYTEQLRAALDECLATLDPEQAEAVRCRYYCGLNLKDTGTRMGITPEQARGLENRGLRKLRNPQNVRRLEQYRQQIISEGAYHGTGWAAWNSGGSVEERVIVHLEDKGLL